MMNSTPEERGCQAAELKKVPSQGLTSSDLNSIIKEVGGKPPSIADVIQACNPSKEAQKKAIEESRKLIESFSKNLANYPKHLTYEGSVVLCVAISVNDGKGVSLNGMPQEDRDVIAAQLPSDAINKLALREASLDVKFDEVRDFILTYTAEGVNPVKLRFFNTVIHPQKLQDTNLAVEKEGGKVVVGNSLVLDQKRIQKLVGVTHEKPQKENEDEQPQRRQPVSGRNAYEIRSDVLQMAIDWVSKTNACGVKDEDDVLTLAKKFYSFVEDRRR